VRRILTPRWLALHVFVVLVVLLFCRLGWWQWDRFRSATGGIQNIVYAFQWPSFAAFGVHLWLQTVRDELHPDRPGAAQRRRQSAPEPASPQLVAAASPDGSGPTEPEDPELAAYNRYLASLAAQDEQRRR